MGTYSVRVELISIVFIVKLDIQENWFRKLKLRRCWKEFWYKIFIDWSNNSLDNWKNGIYIGQTAIRLYLSTIFIWIWILIVTRNLINSEIIKSFKFWTIKMRTYQKISDYANWCMRNKFFVSCNFLHLSIDDIVNLKFSDYKTSN